MSKFPMLIFFFAVFFFTILFFPYKWIIFSNKSVNSKILIPQTHHKKSDKVVQKKTYISIFCIHKPKKIWLYNEGKIIVSTNKIDFEAEFDINFTKKNEKKVIRFNIQADWGKAIERSALQIKVEPENMQSRSITLWAEGFLDEIVTLSW